MEYFETDLINASAELAQNFTENLLSLENKPTYLKTDSSDKTFTVEAENIFQEVYDIIYNKLSEETESYEIVVAVSRNLEAKTVKDILKEGVTMTLTEFETSVNQGALDMFQNVFKFYKRKKEL